MNKHRGQPAVRVTLEFRPVDGEGLCFDNAHGDYGPSALSNVENMLKGMLHHIQEMKMISTVGKSARAGKPSQDNARLDQLHGYAMRSYENQEKIIRNALKTARYDVITNWNWDDDTETPN